MDIGVELCLLQTPKALTSWDGTTPIPSFFTIDTSGLVWVVSQRCNVSNKYETIC
jgi:hypothetical protein